VTPSRWPGSQRAVFDRQRHAVVGYERRAVVQDQMMREARFSRARSAADQNANAGKQNAARMDGVHFAAGSRTVKRAPRTSALPSLVLCTGDIRFSAQIAPPCASTICLEIESPRPEF
jgi:hypothetical protein